MRSRNVSIRALLAMLAALAIGVSPAAAQVRSVDPDAAIDADLSGNSASSAPAPVTYPDTTYPDTTYSETSVGNGTPTETWTSSPAPAPPADQSATYHEDDLIGAAEGVFGKGAEGLAGIIEDILGKQGEPNGYITGREAGGALAIGLRYGSGTLHHKIEGNRPVYWTGPSLGFDVGANAANAFVLVYNLNDTQELFNRYAAGEGQAYLVGGFNVSYLRRGDVVLIPVRMGAGLRLGANIGYMKFSENQNWLPF